MSTHSKVWLLAALAAIFFFFSCKNEAAEQGSDADAVAVPPDALFQLLPPEATGVAFSNTFKETHQLNIFNFGHLYNGGGVGILDVNRDGLQDLFFTATLGSCKLYLNKGNFKFEDITARARVAAAEGLKTGVAVADVNGDGWQDIYVCRSGPNAGPQRRNLLFMSNQDGTFYEAAQQYGVDDAAATSMANFLDYDRDGDLDLYLVNTQTNFGTTSSMNVVDLGGGKFARAKTPEPPFQPHRLLRNDGERFTDVTQQAGTLDFGYGLSAVSADFNDDNFPDLYVGNDFIVPDFLYLNTRNGAFAERGFAATRHMANHTMGTDVADINADGLPDILTLDMLPEDFPLQQQRVSTMKDERYFTLATHDYGHQFMRNVLQLNNGNGTFSDIACLAGVFQTDWSWAPLIQDFDNDGYRDFYITNGYYRDVTNADFMEFTLDSLGKLRGSLQQHYPNIDDLLRQIPQFKLLNYAYRNRAAADAGLAFDDVSQAWGLAQKSFSNGATTADLDNDGDLDLVVNNLMQPAFIYKNTAAERKTANWLQLKLEGSPRNPFATGARVRAWAADGRIFSEDLTPVRGFWSSVEPLVHFGLGALTQLARVEVFFPEGRVLRLTDVPANQRLTLKFADAKPGNLTPLPAPLPFAREAGNQSKLAFEHRESAFHDFDRERLLPWKLSLPGPCLASADANADGLADFYVGGAENQAGALFLQNRNGSFSTTSAPTWAADAGYQDAGALFLDADGDGDQDLFVASGGNEQPAGSPAYQARLYLNDGKGNFARAAAALPNASESAAAVSAHDFDGDGDVDIFLGGHCVPGAYPTVPSSRVLRNDGGKFTDATRDAAPDFEKIGMIRAMEWADLDGDRAPELIVAGEWMPISVFKNAGGRLQNASAQFDLSRWSGFWRSLRAADFDGDGDLDLVAGNLGLNSRHRASDAEPLTMYARDFDNNGSLEAILCRAWQGTERPLAFHKTMVKQMPVLKKKYLRAQAYAEATAAEIFGQSALDGAQKLRANELRSLYFENKGGGHFEPRPLPMLAQMAPACAILAFDANRDGHLDLVLAGNDYGQQIETQRIDSGNGCVLLGDGHGNFRALPARESGFWATLDARSMALLPTVGGKNLVLVGNSGGTLQAFEF